jgi:1-acyl-sn-glycerol-3-phosphate acyltransferase
MLPPRWVRRVILAPAVAVGLAVLLSSAPVALLIAAALSPLLPGRWRPLRFLWFFVVYAALEVVALVALFGLWVATGFGAELDASWSQRAHYALVRWFLRVLHWEATRVLGARVVIEASEDDPGPGGPIIVFARHAGAGDSFLIIDTLLSEYGREPRIVLKDTMQWDPVIDTVLNRLPNRFIRSEPGLTGEQVEGRIAELASHLDSNDALVIFPEGGNFTPARRVRAIDRLRRLGHHRSAQRAEQLRHVLAPRPGGAAAALRVATDADAVFVAHTGLEHLSSLRELWDGLPMDRDVLVRWWRVDKADVPREESAVAPWLEHWWTVIDNWIDGHRSAAPARET